METTYNDNTWAYAHDRKIEHPRDGIDVRKPGDEYDPSLPTHRLVSERNGLQSTGHYGIGNLAIAVAAELRGRPDRCKLYDSHTKLIRN